PPQANNGWLKKTPQGNSLNVAKSSAGSTTVAYSDVIKQAASHYGVDETLIKAIIQVESGYNPDVVSRSNAVGF
ncbi:transglycosylase SLT domain-containing protein, partial [Yersinia pestis]|uniref:transglycosylase SLT domain-containing protein n=1 Tax=Yersinia pestis TaxID=632 RepID=UPI000576B3DE